MLTWFNKVKSVKSSYLLAIACGFLVVSCGGGGGGGNAPTTYSLGGSFHWMINPGLVLADGTGKTVDLSPKVATFDYFNFNSGNTYLTAGTPYNVNVQTQPVGLKCAVTNGSGIVAGNVSNVAVECSAPAAVGVIGSLPSAFIPNFEDIALVSNNKIIANFSYKLYQFDPTSSPSGGLTPLVLQNGAGGADLAPSQSFGPITVDSAGNIYVAFTDVACGATGSCKIEKLVPTGVYGTYVASVFAGSTPGYTNASGASAQFTQIQGIAVDSNGNVYVADSGNNVIRKIDAGGNVSTLAGSGTAASIDGTGTGASFDLRYGGVIHSVTIDGANNIYVAENNLTGNIRKVTPAGVVTTLASGILPPAIAADATGNVYSIETEGTVMWQTIRKIAPSGAITTLVAHGAVQLPLAANKITDQGLGGVDAIALDPSGSFYVGGATVYKVTLP